MALADTFQSIVDSLPDDWTDLELDLRIADESRYIDASVYLATCNARPYSHHDWHWRLLVAHRFGHAASAPTVHGTLKLLDEAGIEGELAVREQRAGRVEVTQMWGRPHSVREASRACGRSSQVREQRAQAAESMAQVLAFIPDLLFGSRVQAALSAAGHDVVLAADANGVRERLVDVDVLVVDLTDEPAARAGLVKSLSVEGSLEAIATLAFYSHVEAEVRDIAEKAGFDLVIPRSRMAREGADLITRIVEGSRQ